MRVGVLILPEGRWADSARLWREAESLDFDSAWTYDHLSWRSLQDGPWFSAFPVLAAAACSTARITVGTLVTSPNFRHPVTLAKDAIALDDISGGRFVLGIGSGSPDAGDANVITKEVLQPTDRAARFAEFVDFVDELLRLPATTREGRFFAAYEAHTAPGCLRRPRLPLALAATGSRGLRLAATHADAWVTAGPARWADGFTPEECLQAVTVQVRLLHKACAESARDVASIDRIFVATDMAGSFLASEDHFLRLAESYAAIGITHLVLHWPRAQGIFAADEAIFRRIAEFAVPIARTFGGT
jgi:alkanesulfonate monooxygenase SsuD/methylene tetrahydromethanopterin reductase-like flavin-dependent oxidoreductase (luciferase family)